MSIYAHSTEDPDKAKWELLREHLPKVAEGAAERAGKFGAEIYGSLVGWLHDFGKVDPKFQARLEGSKARFDHAGPGAALAQELYDVLAGILAPIIAGHHTGLMDATRDGEAEPFITPLNERLPGCKADLSKQKKLWQEEGLAYPPRPSGMPVKPRKTDQHDLDAANTFCLAFFTRMLFSALVDADFIATESFYDVKDRGFANVALSDLKQRLDDFMETKSREARQAHPGIVNETRAEILAAARAKAEDSQGIFTLAVPTGGGKTLASLAFALDHAVTHGLDRVIVVIPFTSVVEQTAQVFRDALGEDSHQFILEHHSAFDETQHSDGRDAPEMGEKLRFAQENWDAPIIVTTAVQFFESLFHNKVSRCRKLHNIARSVVILDEAQTLPLPVLKPIVLAIDELARNYHVTIVLSTATQPALLDDPKRPEQSFPGGLRNVTPIIENTASLFHILKRVEIERIGKCDDESLAATIAQHDQGLTIVNTRKHARILYSRIREEEGARHLSTMMCAAHRTKVLNEIRHDLREGRPARVISTSLIEAGVDISFPIVLRAEAGLDQIAQAAGRCNREGKQSQSDSRVLIFETEEANSHQEMRQRWSAAQAVWRRLERGELEGSLLDPPAIEAYFQELFWVKGRKALDENGILPLLCAYAPSKTKIELPMESIARRFKMIDDTMVPLIIGWDATAQALIDDLQSPFLTSVGGIARKLQRYLVTMPPRDRARLIQRGAAEVIKPQRFGEQFVVLTDRDLYRENVGLDVSDPAFVEAAGLVV